MTLVRRRLAQLRREGVIRSIKPQTGYELKWEAVNWADYVAVMSSRAKMKAASTKVAQSICFRKWLSSSDCN